MKSFGIPFIFIKLCVILSHENTFNNEKAELYKASKIKIIIPKRIIKKVFENSTIFENFLLDYICKAIFTEI